MTARCVMVLGTSSGAGKSWITTALCRYYANKGLKVAPFKAQNMSNNARVVASVVSTTPDTPGGEKWQKQAMPEAGEIGSAQYFQALAAKAEPEVRMNPLLLKPEADTHSQVVLLGQVSPELTALPWRGRSERVWPQIAAALDALRAENDVVVIEGAGSPAEINLMANDVVNLRVARHADARCLLVTDIDRGGAFAHLYGTWALLPEEDRARINGFVLNKFRGDAALLAPAPEQIRELTGVPVVAVVPMRFGHGLPEEDGLFDERAISGPSLVEEKKSGVTGASSPAQGEDTAKLRPRHIAIIAYPRISNLDEFQPLKNVPGLHVSWVRTPSQIQGADTLILPGSKSTASDLAWLREQGLDAAIAEHAARGGRVLGICGGLQMLGEALIDVYGIESQGNAPGLGLLPLVTSFEPQKTVRRTRVRFDELKGPWAALSSIEAAGYEIHSGQTAQHPAMAAKGDVAREIAAGLGWQNVAGNVLGVYVHGLFEDEAVLRALFGAQVLSLEDVFERLAAGIEADFAPGVLDALIA
ncbi:cobyric acid synthase [Ottowia thiooxydans]|uniref:cobyric acid synthase n=1 Tax=Ottowia thiooxydans TaxID=219182 RepID=UPI000424DA0B|nr:cobyric acid synthase [Ottowia thiooxydans]